LNRVQARNVPCQALTGRFYAEALLELGSIFGQRPIEDVE
jgi:hypothetical protein